MSDADDDVILRYFLKAKLPDRLVEDFFTFFVRGEVAACIRSSSLLEDSHYQPFAGIYNTYMIPYLDDKYEMLRMLSDASREYMLRSTSATRRHTCRQRATLSTRKRWLSSCKR